MSGERPSGAEASRGTSAWTGLALMVAIVPLAFLWTALLRDGGSVLIACGAALTVLAMGIIARALRAPERLVTPLELLVLAGIVLWLASGFDAITRIPSVITDALRRSTWGTTPLQPGAGSSLLVCLGIGLLAILADHLVVSQRRPAAVLIPQLILYAIPVHTAAGKDQTAPGVLALGVGLALVLLATHRLRFPSGPAGLAPRAGVLALAAAATAGALALTVSITPAIAPPAANRNADPIQMTDVSLELKRQISQGANQPAFEYVTDGTQGAYLRLYSLPTFSADGWRLANSTVQYGPLLPPPGLTRGVPRKTTVKVTGLRSEWLPVPYAPTSTSVGDEWGYLPESLAVLAPSMPDRTAATSGLSYTASSLDSSPSDADLLAAQAASPPDAALTATVPDDVPESLKALTAQVTRGATTPGAKAQAILSYLRGPEFSYSLDAQPGSGYPGLEEFLTKDHKGFCVQYAASMAIMARIAGVPSRVAIGFTPGKRVGDHWAVTMYVMHSWPELYFADWGWVSFEPTPGLGATTAPTAPNPTAEPSATQSAAASPRPAPAQPTTTPAGTASGDTTPWGWLIAVAGLLIALALAAPAFLRHRRRARLLAPGKDARRAALDAWDELRATTLDYGFPWPSGSPRFASETLVAASADKAGTRSTAADGVLELGLAAERAQFGGPDDPPQARDWRPVVDAQGALQAARVPWKRRVRAVVFPASLFRR